MGYMKSFIGREHLLFKEKVCYGCFGDTGIIEFIKENGKSKGCDYCNSQKKSHGLGEVIDYINDCLLSEYEDPAESMSYITSEGGYQGKTYDSWDLLDHVGLEVDYELLGEIANGLPNSSWCERDPYQLREYEELYYDWKEFSNLLKHKCRFMFLKHETKSDHYTDEQTLISNILHHIQKLFEENGLIRKISKGTKIYRARQFNKKEPFSLELKELCPPPEKLSRNSRMSPAGIPMFYGAKKIETTLRELQVSGKDEVVVCSFTLQEDIYVVDLTSLREVPSIFDNTFASERSDLIFLKSFLNDFIKPIKKDGVEHIDYVPTQVVTEFCKYNIKYNDHQIRGFIYPSSVNKKKEAYCLFFDGYDCGLKKDSYLNDNRTFLQLNKRSIRKITADKYID